ncbi:hypothetical protein [Rhizobium tibeticum]|uniref:hypothetical protein n=1 Tax=Rhizobium tibeticum TaxID=501024 RepID=UPI001FCD01B9|nr:hypothetical protein [Rhizobium tibeticum]
MGLASRHRLQQTCALCRGHGASWHEQRNLPPDRERRGAIRGRSTDFELGRKQCHISGCDLASPVLQEFPNRVFAPARFIPKRIDFIGKSVAHCRNTVDYLDCLILTLSDKIQVAFSN